MVTLPGNGMAAMTMPVAQDTTLVHTAAAPVSFHRLTVAWVGGLAGFLDALAAAGDDRLFHPHPIDVATLHGLAAHPAAGTDRHDEYHLAVSGDGTVVAYGLLRGWGAGYAVPSLGVAVHPAARGRGLARQMIEHLHGVARGRGALRVRLTVYRDNAHAITLYRALGYRMEPHGDRQWCGFLELDRSTRGNVA